MGPTWCFQRTNRRSLRRRWTTTCSRETTCPNTSTKTNPRLNSTVSLTQMLTPRFKARSLRFIASRVCPFSYSKSKTLWLLRPMLSPLKMSRRRSKLAAPVHKVQTELEQFLLTLANWTPNRNSWFTTPTYLASCTLNRPSTAADPTKPRLHRKSLRSPSSASSRSSRELGCSRLAPTQSRDLGRESRTRKTSS